MNKIRKAMGVLLTTFFYCFLFLFPLLPYEKEIKSISLAMAESIANAGKKTIAVVDFTDLQGNVTELGRFLSEEISMALASAGKGFEVVDRTHLKIILQEHKLSSTGLIDPQTARKLGQIAGVDALITGSLTPFGDSVRLAVKILDSNTAKMIGASSLDIAKTKAIEELLMKGIVGVTDTSPTVISQPSAPSIQRGPTKSIMKVEANKFTFELQQCKMSGNTLTFHFLITNNDQDRQLSMYRSRIVDDLGNEASAERLLLGNAYPYTGSVTNNLVSEIPMKASIIFENISFKPNFIALLEIPCNSNGQFKVQFRNIPITK